MIDGRCLAGKEREKEEKGDSHPLIFFLSRSWLLEEEQKVFFFLRNVRMVSNVGAIFLEANATRVILTCLKIREQLAARERC